MINMKRIKTGLASYGMSGQVFHAPFIHTDPGFELTAITERSKNLANERYPYVRIVRSFEELIKIEELELVVVNTPDSTHYQYARLALEAGKHVIVEKPFTSTEKEGRELIRIAEQNGLMLSVYQNRRWDSDFLTVKDILDKGLLGRVVEFESCFPRYRNYIQPGTWKETGEWGGGLLYNLGSHLLDQAVQLFGVPEAVFADTAILRSGGMVDDYFMIRFFRPERYPELKITLKASYLMCEPEPRFILHGTEGSYVKYGLDRQEEDLKSGMMPDTAGWGEEPEESWGLLHVQKDGGFIREKYPSLAGNYGAFYENIKDHLRNNAPLLTNAKDLPGVIKIIESISKNGLGPCMLTSFSSEVS